MEKWKLILASGSPRRKELLLQAGLDFEVQVSDVEEIVNTSIPEELVVSLARQKAGAVCSMLLEREKNEERQRGDKREIILAADTVVAYEQSILGKPKDRDEAVRMINLLQGKTHQVYTGVVLMDMKEQREIVTFAEKTDVLVRKMTVPQIEAYVDTGEPYDKAGGYGIQGGFAAYIPEIRGDYYNVVGLPLSRVCQELDKL